MSYVVQGTGEGISHKAQVGRQKLKQVKSAKLKGKSEVDCFVALLRAMTWGAFKADSPEAK
jgi:hypothetical protein